MEILSDTQGDNQAASAAPDRSATLASADTAVQQESTFEEQLGRTNQLLLSNTLNRPVLLRILQATVDAALPLFDLESLIQKLPEFKAATQPPYFLIEWLVDTGALLFIEVDALGNPLSEELRAEKTEDEIDDLIEDIIIEITEVGRQILEEYDPTDRLTALLGDHLSRKDTYLEVLEFLTERHSYNEVDQLLRGRLILRDGRESGDPDMQPSVFVDKLASAGGIVFDKGWIITPEGLALLQAANSS